MHCGSGGQAECGGNPADRPAADFKRAFEIEFTRKTAPLTNIKCLAAAVISGGARH
jgi:hypothetical protein